MYHRYDSYGFHEKKQKKSVPVFVFPFLDRETTTTTIIIIIISPLEGKQKTLGQNQP